MQRPFPQPEHCRAQRTIALLLALLMVVAPAFHVCEMGGRHCAAHQGERSCHDPSLAAGFQVVNATDTPFGGTCLARLLMATPAGVSAPLVLAFIPPRGSTLVARIQPLSSAFFASRPPARGPPFFSF